MPKIANSRTRKKSTETATLVLASVKPYTRHNIPQYEVATYACACGHKGAVQASLGKPHCAKCGSEVATVKETNTTVARIENAASSVSILCSCCNTHNIMATTAALDFDGKVHCSNCGDYLAYDKSEVESDDFENDVDLNNDTGADDISDSIHSSMHDDDVDIVDNIDDVEESGYDDEDDTTDEEESDVEDENLDDLGDGDDDADDTETKEADDYLGGDVADDPDTESGETEDDIEDESVVSKVKVLPTPIINTASVASCKDFRLVPELASGNIHIFAKDHCVATLKESPENRLVFGKPVHLELIKASLKDSGFEKTASAFNFTLATVKLSKAKTLETTVAKVAKDHEVKLASKIKAQAAVLRESLEIAAVGLNRDIFAATHSNPLKDEMLKMLASLGVDKVSAAMQVQAAFAKAGDDFVDVLLEKAHEIASYDPKVRGQLASTYASLALPVPNLEAASSEDEYDVDGNDEVDTYFQQADQNQTVHQDNYDSVTATVASRLDNPLRASKETASKTTTTSSGNLFKKTNLSYVPR